MASGPVSRTNRPNRWLLRPALRRALSLDSPEPSTHGPMPTFGAIRLAAAADPTRTPRVPRKVGYSAEATPWSGCRSKRKPHDGCGNSLMILALADRSHSMTGTIDSKRSNRAQNVN
jgi:hypothetical protein